MDKKTFPEWLFSLLVLALACGLALYLRIALPWANVFDGQWIKFTSNDAYFYMRMVDNLVHNFPQLYGFDPYLIYPSGFSTGNYPTFFVYLLAAIVKLLGGASPSQQAIDSISVYLPAILGALTVIPVYFIGRLLINRWAGAAAAIALAVMPGELLVLSLLGNTDHHSIEILLACCFALFFMLAIKHGRQFTYTTLMKGQFSEAGAHLHYALIAGVFFGLYLITWTGALLMLFIVFLYFIVQFISDHLRGFPTDYLSKVAITCFLISLLIFVPVSRDKLTLLALAAVILVPIMLNALSAVLSLREVRRSYYLAVIVGLVALGATAFWLVFPAQFQAAFSYTSSIFAWRMEQNVVGEMKPLLFPGGTFTMEMAWSQFALVLYSGLAGLALTVYLSIREGRSEYIFMSVWSLVMLLACLAMVRFATYLTVCLVLLTGCLAGWVIQAAQPHESAAQRPKPVKKSKRTAAATRFPLRTVLISAATCIAAIALLFPGTANAVSAARHTSFAPSDAWMESMQWMQQNTQEPFGKGDFYYKLYDTPSENRTYDYPATFYSVAVWPDYGYWVTRLAHRVPVANPGSYGITAGGYATAAQVAGFLLSPDQQANASLMENWRARYVIVDSRIASPNDKFYALAGLNNQQESDYYELCWVKKEGKYEPLLVFYPEFYRAAVIHLYNFDGQQVAPERTLVMAYQDRSTADGQQFKEITGIKSFDGYAGAESYIAGQKEGQYKIIGTDPLASPVPLDKLTGYSTAYQSEQKASAGSATALPAVKIFEYTSSSK
ncbi:MAG: oligosaccharyl transferase, archaeosortase A system-associated [Dehalococcoidia bacterium]|nr:oligosaccharyl transferase, archaeosortase A system-associated [Dehalococcoidia bacterium]